MKNYVSEFVFDKEMENEIEASVKEFLAEFMPKRTTGRDEKFYEYIRTAMDCLESEEKEVVETMYGIKDGQTKTVEEAARILCLTEEKVNEINAKALRKLRHPFSK